MLFQQGDDRCAHLDAGGLPQLPHGIAVYNGHVLFPAQFPEGTGESGVRVPGQIDGPGRSVPNGAAGLFCAGDPVSAL